MSKREIATCTLELLKKHSNAFPQGDKACRLIKEIHHICYKGDQCDNVKIPEESSQKSLVAGYWLHREKKKKEVVRRQKTGRISPHRIKPHEVRLIRQTSLNSTWGRKKKMGASSRKAFPLWTKKEMSL